MTFPKSFQVGGSLPIPLVISNKTAAYTVQATDAETIINCTSGTFTVSLTAAATLLSGFNVTIWNTSTTSTDVITIDPAGSETIDGRTTLILQRGEGMQIVCNGTNWETGNKKTMRGYADNISSTSARPTASGSSAIAFGASASASGSSAIAIGFSSTASNSQATAIGVGSVASGVGSLATNGGTASSSYAVAIGQNSSAGSSQAVTGAGAMALGGSYASGTDSFAAAIANNTSTYGAQGANSVAMGRSVKATSAGALALGGNAAGCVASGLSSIAIGGYNYGPVASAYSSVAIGDGAKSAISGKFAYAGYSFASSGDGQSGTLVTLGSTTNATATVLTSDLGAAGTTNQLILANNQAMVVTGTVICRQSVAGSDKASGWTFTAVIRRGANAASTALVAAVTPILVAQDLSLAATVVAVTADTTNGGLAVTVTGLAATNLRWVATLQSAEAIYA